MPPNLKAFLDMLAWSEGTSTVAGSDDGYNVVVGGGLFHNDYVDHPRQMVYIENLRISSSAAGRYQLLARYWDIYKHSLGLTDFGHDSQDRVAIQQIRECKAIDDIEAGRLNDAIAKCARIWASLPGSNYNQHVREAAGLRAKFALAGGLINEGA